MRKVMSLMLMISGLAVGCGDSSDTSSTDDPSTAADGGGDNGGNTNTVNNSDPNGGSNNNIPIPEDASAGGETPPPAPLYPMCNRPAAVAALGPAGSRWEGDPPFTMAMLDDCLKKCPMGEFTCIESMCENGMAFGDCFNGEIGACAAVGDDALCKTEWENLGCCVIDKKCDLTTQEGGAACVGGSGPCATDLGTFRTCSASCQQAAQRRCIGPASAGGGATGGTTGADVDPAGPGGGMMSIPASFMSDAPVSVFNAR